MKTLFFALLIVIISTKGFAQTEKGTMMLGGQISFSGSNSEADDDNENSYNFFVSPDFGFFFKDRWAFGADLDFGYGKMDGSGDFGTWGDRLYESRSNTYGGGFFIRNYLPLADQLYLTLTGSADYDYKTSYSSTTYSLSPSFNTESEYETNQIRAAISPGLTYFVSPKIGVSAGFSSLYYTYAKTRDKSGPASEYETSHSYGLLLRSSTISLGLRYFF